MVMGENLIIVFKNMNNLDDPLPDVGGQKGIVDDVLQQVGPQLGDVAGGQLVPLAYQALLQQPARLEQHVVVLALLQQLFAHLIRGLGLPEVEENLLCLLSLFLGHKVWRPHEDLRGSLQLRQRVTPVHGSFRDCLGVFVKANISVKGASENIQVGRQDRTAAGLLWSLHELATSRCPHAGLGCGGLGTSASLHRLDFVTSTLHLPPPHRSAWRREAIKYLH